MLCNVGNRRNAVIESRPMTWWGPIAQSSIFPLTTLTDSPISQLFTYLCQYYSIKCRHLAMNADHKATLSSIRYTVRLSESGAHSVMSTGRTYVNPWLALSPIMLPTGSGSFSHNGRGLIKLFFIIPFIHRNYFVVGKTATVAMWHV
jgi:hypothetical protein